MDVGAAMYKSIAVGSPKSSRITSLYLVGSETKKIPNHLKGDAALITAFKEKYVRQRIPRPPASFTPWC